MTVDDYSRKNFICLIKNKSDVIICVKTFFSLMKNQTGKSIKVFRCDNGREYVNNKLKEF